MVLLRKRLFPLYLALKTIKYKVQQIIKARILEYDYLVVTNINTFNWTFTSILIQCRNTINSKFLQYLFYLNI